MNEYRRSSSEQQEKINPRDGGSKSLLMALETLKDNTEMGIDDENDYDYVIEELFFYEIK